MFDAPHVMAVVNITPDSFSDGARYNTYSDYIRYIEKILTLNVKIIDIGGQSTRPGANIIDPETEWNRINLVLSESIKMAQGKALISVDTFYGYVAAKALDMGADIINDVSGAEWVRDHTWPIIASHPSCGYVLTHAKGTPDLMQKNPTYENIIQQIHDYFSKKIEQLQVLGIAPERITIDPGIGFGKTTEHNLQILRHLNQFKTFNRPILIGLSRKRILRDILHIPSTIQPQDSTTIDLLDHATSVLNLIATTNGAHIWRVHNPLNAIQTIRLWKAYKGIPAQAHAP